MSAALYEQIYSEVRPHVTEDQAEYLADTLAFMNPDKVRRLFNIIDNYEPNESEQGLIPIPEAYNEQ